MDFNMYYTMRSYHQLASGAGGCIARSLKLPKIFVTRVIRRVGSRSRQFQDHTQAFLPYWRKERSQVRINATTYYCMRLGVRVADDM